MALHINSLTISASKIGSDLTDFLLLINLEDMDIGFWSNVASDGSDCYVTDNSDVLLPYFLVDFDNIGKTGYIYVKTNMSSTIDNTYKVFAGEGVTDQQNTTLALSNYAAFFVASNDGNLYELVTSTSWTDGNTTSIVSENMGLHPQTGYPIVSGNRIEGTTSTTLIANSIASLSNFTIAITSIPTVNAGASRSLIIYATDYSASPSRYGLHILNASPYPLITWNPSDSSLNSTFNPTLGTVTRAHLTTESGVERRIYAQGSQVAIDTTINATSAALDTVILGVEDASRGELFSGNLAHGYIRTGALTADYISAEYENMTDPSIFYSPIVLSPDVNLTRLATETLVVSSAVANTAVTRVAVETLYEIILPVDTQVTRIAVESLTIYKPPRRMIIGVKYTDLT